MEPEPVVRAATPGDLPWVRSIITQRWGSVEMVTGGRVKDASAHRALIASADGQDVGLLTYRHEGNDVEIVSIDALISGRGAGRQLLSALQGQVRREQLASIYVYTTNDNVDALAFYQRCGLRMVAIDRDAVTRAREIKPSIPHYADNGIEIRDEVRLEWS